VKTFLAGSVFARYILYLPNFTILNKNKSPTNFQTLQNGGVRLDEIPKKIPKLCQSAVEQKNRQPFVSSKLDNFQQN